MPYLTPNAPTGNSGRVLVIPDTYAPTVNGALMELLTLYNWEEFGDDTPQDAVDRMQLMIDDYLRSSIEEFSGMASPITPHIWNYHQASAAPDWTSLSSFRGGGYYASGNNAINGYIQWRVSFSAGDWMLYANVRKATNSGIAKVLIDGEEIGTMDLYNNALQESITTLLIEGVTAGNKIVKLLFDTKNASSSNYGWNIGQIAFQRL